MFTRKLVYNVFIQSNSSKNSLWLLFSAEAAAGDILSGKLRNKLFFLFLICSVSCKKNNNIITLVISTFTMEFNVVGPIALCVQVYCGFTVSRNRPYNKMWEGKAKVLLYHYFPSEILMCGSGIPGIILSSQRLYSLENSAPLLFWKRIKY